MKMWSWFLLVVLLGILAMIAMQDSVWNRNDYRIATPEANSAKGGPTPNAEAVKRDIQQKINEKTRLYQEKNNALLQEFLTKLPNLGDEAFRTTDGNIENFVAETTKFGFCCSLAAKLAKDKLTGSTTVQESLTPVIGEKFYKPLVGAQNEIRDELENLLLRLRENDNQYRAGLAELTDGAEFQVNDFQSNGALVEKLNKVYADLNSFTINKTLSAVFVGIDALFLQSTYRCIASVCSAVAAKLAGTASVAAISAAADGPLPIGDVIGAVVGVGGILWSCYDIYEVTVTLPREMRASLTQMVGDYRTAIRQEAAEQARTAVEKRNRAAESVLQ